MHRFLITKDDGDGDDDYDDDDDDPYWVIND